MVNTNAATVTLPLWKELPSKARAPQWVWSHVLQYLSKLPRLTPLVILFEQRRQRSSTRGIRPAASQLAMVAMLSIQLHGGDSRDNTPANVLET